MVVVVLLDDTAPGHGLVSLVEGEDMTSPLSAALAEPASVLVVANPENPHEFDTGQIPEHLNGKAYRLTPVSLDSLLRALHAAQNILPALMPRALSAREREVLALMVEGLNNTAIALRLGVSLSTAKFHVSSILSKLAVAGRVEAVAHAVRDGLIPVS
jgi:DNA-binding NarL/FixJ family response regulator